MSILAIHDDENIKCNLRNLQVESLFSPVRDMERYPQTDKYWVNIALAHSHNLRVSPSLQRFDWLIPRKIHTHKYMEGGHTCNKTTFSVHGFTDFWAVKWRLLNQTMLFIFWFLLFYVNINDPWPTNPKRKLCMDYIHLLILILFDLCISKVLWCNG